MDITHLLTGLAGAVIGCASGILAMGRLMAIEREETARIFSKGYIEGYFEGLSNGRNESKQP